MERQGDDGAADVVIRAQKAEARLQALQAASRELLATIDRMDYGGPIEVMDAADRLESLVRESES